MITNTMSLSFIEFDFLQPECLAEGEVNTYIWLSTLQLGTIALGFLIPSVASSCFACCRRRASSQEQRTKLRERSDSAIFVQTM